MDILAEINRVMELEGRTLAKLRAAVGPAYEKAVRLIFDCPGKVILTGIGKSGIVAQKIASTMVSTGTPAMFLHPAEAAHGDIGIAHKDDVIVAMNGKDIDGRSLRLAVGAMAPGTTIDLKVLRGSSEQKFSVTLDTMPADTQRAEENEQPPVPRRNRRG